MPELPEVETVVRGMAQVLPGLKVTAVEGIAPMEAVGKQVQSVRRYGKFIILDFSDGMLFIHLGMTGQLMVSSDTSKFTRGRLLFEGATVRYDDIRKFGKMFWDTHYPKRGPDPLELTPEEFIALAKRRKTRIKALLLDQSALRGMGNIYTDEALFHAKIHPCASAAKLSRARLATLHQCTREILREAIAAGGSSISDYVDARGEKGGYQLRHQVYGKHGQPCPICGTVLQRMLVTQRGTTFCPRCQTR
ncbi:MAG: bifunctional DNA-formamidopyrimidine glycosylase/DNA-(apurinic or apyrimidinic site) lyase [Acidobacteria bacterium]|nr:bifunctional DNA-formamidopyrimidine glycosylase/DNA-(apurinic or apyrimidinic site) lyase [Acidobacteriota bacterium]